MAWSKRGRKRKFQGRSGRRKQRRAGQEKFERLEERQLLASDFPQLDLSTPWPRATAPDLLPEQLFAIGPSAVLQRVTPLLTPSVRTTNPRYESTIVLVDSRVDDYESLLKGRLPADPSGMLVQVLDPDRDGIEQITEILQQHTDVTAIHLVSHGDQASLELGASRLDPQNLDPYTLQLREWDRFLSDDADLFLYGCNVAMGTSGIRFVDDLARLTGADVAASTDLTGAAALGGNWALEYTTGQVADVNLFAAQPPMYAGLLVTEDVAAHKATAQGSDLSSTQTIHLTAGIHTLDLSAIDKDLLVTVRADNTKHNRIVVQEMNGAGTGVGSVVTYEVQNDAGGVDNLIAGKPDRKVKLVLESELASLSFTSVNAGQLAIGRKAATLGWLTGPNSIAVLVQNNGALKELTFGKASDSSLAELLVGRDIQVDSLVKGSGFAGKLKVSYPEADDNSLLTQVLDLSVGTPRLRSFGRLQGFTAADIREVQVAGGRQEIRIGSQTPVDVRGGAGDDVLIAQGAAQTLEGEAGNDVLEGGAGADILRGGLGNDVLKGGPDSDTLDGGADQDTYVFEQIAWGAADSIVDAGGNDTLDFQIVEGKLTFSLGNSGLTVSADREISPTLADDVSLGSDDDAVSVAVANLPAATIAAGAIQAVANTSFSFNLAVGAARQSVSVNGPSAVELEAALADSASSQGSAGISIRRVGSDVRLQVRDKAIAYHNGLSWTRIAPSRGVSELRLTPLLAELTQQDPSLALDNPANQWTVAATTLRLAIGEFSANSNPADFEAASFEVSLFDTTPWTTGYVGSYGEAVDQWRAYVDGSMEGAIEAAAARRGLLGQPAHVDRLAQELWLEAIASQISTAFSIPTSDVLVDTISTDGATLLSISLANHVGDIAAAPSGTTIPAALSSSLTQQQRVTTTAPMERFIAPTSDQAEVLYDIDALDHDLTIEFSGTQAKSTLDLSGLGKDLELRFVKPGQVEVDVVETGAVTATLTAGGIAKVIVGDGDHTFVVNEASAAGKFSIEGQGSGERHLVLGEGFAGATVVLNNSDSDFVVESETYTARSWHYSAGMLAQPELTGISFDSVTADDSFLGTLYVKGVPSVRSGRGGDRVYLTEATPAGQTISTGQGDDRVEGSGQQDVVDAGAGSDVVQGFAGNDQLTGGPGDDVIVGGAGDDTLIGGGDNDTYRFDSTGWGVDSVEEETGQGDRDRIDFAAVNAAMVHVISGNDYHAFTGANSLVDSQNRLSGSQRSLGEVKIYDPNNETWNDFDPTNPNHVDASADRVSVTGQQFQNIEQIAVSQGDNTFYFGNDWGPDAFLTSAASQLGGAAAPGWRRLRPACCQPIKIQKTASWRSIPRTPPTSCSTSGR